MESQLSTTASVRLRPMPSPTTVSMELMEAMVSQLSPLTDTHLSTTMASVMLMLSPTMVSMEPMVSQLSPPTDTHLSTTMASAMLMLMPSPTMVSMEPMVSQLSPPTDTQLSTTMASVMLMLMLSPTMVSTPSHTLDTVATLTPTCTNFAMVH